MSSSSAVLVARTASAMRWPAAKDDYDLVLIDCAPSIDQLMINGLTAADGSPHRLSHQAVQCEWILDNCSRPIDEVREYYNRQLAVAGVLINQHEEQTVSGRTWAEELQTAAQDRQLTDPRALHA